MSRHKVYVSWKSQTLSVAYEGRVLFFFEMISININVILMSNLWCNVNFNLNILTAAYIDKCRIKFYYSITVRKIVNPD